MTPPPPRSTLFPYTTLFRSQYPKLVLTPGVTAGGGKETSDGAPADDNRDGGSDGSGGVGASTSPAEAIRSELDRKSTRLNSSHPSISYAVFCLKKKKKNNNV